MDLKLLFETIKSAEAQLASVADTCKKLSDQIARLRIAVAQTAPAKSRDDEWGYELDGRMYKTIDGKEVVVWPDGSYFYVRVGGIGEPIVSVRHDGGREGCGREHRRRDVGLVKRSTADAFAALRAEIERIGPVLGLGSEYARACHRIYGGLKVRPSDEAWPPAQQPAPSATEIQFVNFRVPVVISEEQMATLGPSMAEQFQEMFTKAIERENERNLQEIFTPRTACHEPQERREARRDAGRSIQGLRRR